VFLDPPRTPLPSSKLGKTRVDLKFLVGREASGPISEISCFLKMFRKEGMKEGMKEAGNEGLMDLEFLACVGGFHIPDMIRPLTRAKFMFLSGGPLVSPKYLGSFIGNNCMTCK